MSHSLRSRPDHLVDETYLTRNQEVSVIFASLSYTVLAIVSLFGSVHFLPPNFAQHEHSLVPRLIGTIMQRRSYISLYHTVIWSHLAFNIVAGAYFIYTLFHKVGEEDLSNCLFYCSDDIIAQLDCIQEFQVYRNVIICLYIIFCLLELCASSSLYLSTFIPPSFPRFATRSV